MIFSSPDKQQPEPSERPVVLLVDDEENILKALTRSLKRLPVDIVTAASGVEALQLMDNTGVDLIISDMRMPEMDGAEFLSQVTERAPQTIRFLLTGHSDVKDVVRAVNEGKIHHYLTKPWDDTALRSLVEETLGARSLKLHNQQLNDELSARNQELQELNRSLEQRVRDRTEELMLNARLIRHAFSDLQKSYGHVLRLASSLAALRDPGAAAAGDMRSTLAESLAEALDLSAQDVREIRDAALLSEIGNIALPDELLKKPFNEYDGGDMRFYAQVPVVAEASLMGIPGMKNTSAMLRSQFERYDGSGYPDHLAGNNIPVGARIIALVRDYTDLIRGRFTGEPVSAQAARTELINQSSSRYDPVLVNIFCERCSAFNADELAANEIRIAADELQQGMVLAQDLYSERGVILLTRGHELSDELINKLRHLELWSGRELEVLVEREPTNAVAEG